MRPLLVALLAALLAACAAPAARGPTPSPGGPAGAPAAPSPTRAPAEPTGAPSPATATPDAPPPAPTTAAVPRGPVTIGHGQAISAAFVPGADALAVGTSAGVLLLSLPDLEPGAFFPLERAAQELVASPDGRLLAVSGYDGPTATTRVLTLDGAELFATGGREPRFSGDSERLVVAELDNASGRYTSRIFRVGDWAEVGAAPGDRARLSPGGGAIATFDQGELVISVAGGAELFRAPAYTVAFSPDNRTVAVGGLGGIELLALANGALDAAARRALTPTPAQDLAFAGDGTLLAVTQEGVLRWDLAAGGGPWPVPLELGPDMGQLGPGGVMLALTTLVGDAPSTLRLVRSDNGAGLYGDSPFEGGVPSFSPDGREAAVVTAAGAVRLVDVERGVYADRRLPGYSRVALLADGSVAAGRAGPQVDLWPAEGGELPSWSLGAFGPTEALRALALAEDGLVEAEVESVVLGGLVSRLRAVRFLPNAAEPIADAATVPDLALELPAPAWDHAAGRVAWVAPGGAVLVRDAGGAPRQLPAIRGVPDGAAPASVALSPDGARLAVGYGDGTLLVVAPADFTPLASGPFAPGEAIVALAWSGDGLRLAYALAGGDVALWEAVDDDPPVRFAGAPRAESGPPRLALSADGGVLAVGGSEGVAVYSLAAGGELLRHSVRAEDVALAPDGGRVAAAVGGRIMTWPVGE